MENRLYLNGKWDLRWADGQRGGARNFAEEETHSYKALEAEVPGEVHLDLIKAGIIREPALHTNALDCRWVEESIWTYKKTFTVPEELHNCSVWINFEGLDYNARILLNSEVIGEHANFFYPCRIDITGKLKQGENTLVVQLESGLYSVSEKPIRDYYNTSYDTILTKRMWLRKPQNSFSWDWAPRLLNVGIYKSVYIEWQKAARVDQVVLLSELNDDFSKGNVELRLFAEGIKDEDQEAVIEVSIEEIGEKLSFPVKIQRGMQKITEFFTIDTPELWWPVGQGKQELYTIKTKLIIEETIVGQHIKKIGFRKFSVNQERNSNGGRYFTFEINNRKIFVKGANLIPGDVIFARLNRQYYETVVDRALEANFNLLRVWGGGIYESDDLYELCDEKGIMVWQEFVFACGDYPTNYSTLMEDIKKEAVHNVRRLASHASLVVWCGNNENETLTFDRKEGFVFTDYALYHMVLPRILKEEDPGTYYQPSSPYSPDHEYPNRDDMGDQHPWSIGFADVDFHGYRNMICSFPNEGGILGPTSLKAMNACMPEGQRYWNSFAWQIHDNSVEQWYKYSSPDNVLTYWTKLEPKNLSIEDYVYYGGLVQGEGLSEYINNFRRRKYDSSSAIFWMYNDSWPMVRSWTIIDYYLNRTPSFYPVKRAFAPITVVITREEDRIKVYGVNDTAKDVKGQLRYGLFTLDGKYKLNNYEDVVLEANKSSCIASFNVELWDKEGLDKSMAFAMLTENGKLMARNRLLVNKFHELQWSPAQVEVKRDGDEAVFTSSSFAWGVSIDLEGEERLEDNFFDVWPGVEYRIKWDKSRELPAIIKIGNL